MKTFIAVLFTAVIVSSLCAQETKPDAMPSQPAAAPTPTPTAVLDPLSTEPLQLIPDTPSTVPKPSRQSSGQSMEQPSDSPASMDDAKEKLKKSKAVADADDLKERIRFREVKTVALKDGKVQEQWDLAQTATTTREKTAALKQYYNLLYAKMLAMDKSLKPRIEKSKTEALLRLNQTVPFDLNQPVHGKVW